MPGSVNPSMYCRKCGYPLRGLPEPRCPECGRPFDPKAARTYRRRPFGWWRPWVWRWSKRAAIAVFVVALVFTIWAGWTYWSEQRVMRRVEAYGGQWYSQPIGPKRIREWVAKKKLPWLPKVRAVGFKTPSSRRDPNLGYLPHPVPDQVMAAARDRDWRIRRSAISAMGSYTDVRAVDPLLAALKDRDERIRAAATESINRLSGRLRVPDERILLALIDLLGDESASIRRSAMQTLREANRWRFWDERIASAVIPALSDDSSTVVGMAVWVLGHLEDRRAVEPLTHLMSTADDELIRALAQALGQIGDRRAIPSLRARLNPPSPKVIRALGTLGDQQSVVSMIALLGHEEKDVRVAAAEALGRIGDRQAVESLIALLGDIDIDVRAAAARALGRIGDRRAIEPLMAKLDNHSAWIRTPGGVEFAIAAALGAMRDPRVLPLLIDRMQPVDYRWARNYYPDPMAEVQGDAFCFAVVDFRGLAIEPVAEQLTNRQEGQRVAAVWVLGQLFRHRVEPDPALDRLIAALTDDSPRVRTAALKALQHVKDQRIDDAVIDLLADHIAPVRRAAAEASRKRRDPRALPRLIQLVDDPTPEVRAWVAGALGNFEDESALDALVRLLDDKDVTVRSSAAGSLGSLRSASKVELLLTRLNDESEVFRHTVITALGNSGDASAAEGLAQLDETDVQRVHIAVALCRIGDERGFERAQRLLADPAPDDRRRLVERLYYAGISDPRVVPVLSTALNDRWSRVRSRAVGALGRVKQVDTTSLIQPMVDDPDPSVQKRAIRELTKREDPRAVDRLLALLSHAKESVRAFAAYRAGAFDHPPVVDRLIHCLDDSSHQVRMRAAATLGMLKATKAVERLIAHLEDENVLYRSQELLTDSGLLLADGHDQRMITP